MAEQEAAQSPVQSPAQSLAQKLASLPARPGCYVFRDHLGQALYVGKAKSLRSRVKSYFQAGVGDERAFLPFLKDEIVDFETFVVATEKEAAILEHSLVKERQPRFNVKLKDDKAYLNLRLALDVPWPRLELVRRPGSDGASYFGPYPSATAARRTLHLIEKHFQLRTCSDRELASRTRPCLQYQIKRCPAPCVYDVDANAYAEQVSAVSLFLQGRHAELSAALEERMRAASAALNFEVAAACRDQLGAVRAVQETQRVVTQSDRDQDVVGLYRQGDLIELFVLCLRQGRIINVFSWSAKHVELPDDEVVAGFLREHYDVEGGASVPDEVIVPVLPEGAAGVTDWLSERSRQAFGRRCYLIAPERGPRRRLLELAQENARHAFEEKERAVLDIERRLLRLQQKLRLAAPPRRIECSDISHLGGVDTVGAVVAFSDGVPDKARYRTYHIKTAAPGDDYAAMHEMLSRRFRRGKAAEGAASEDPSSEPSALPDLFVVDGGRGQLGVALTAARDLGLQNLAIVGLAKERENATGEKLIDRVYLPGQKNPVSLRENSAELFLLARLRDEAHRFSNRGRKIAGTRRSFRSALDDVPGIGPKTKKALLRQLGSLRQVREASDEELLRVPGIGRKQLERLRAWLGDGPESAESPPEGEGDAREPEDTPLTNQGDRER